MGLDRSRTLLPYHRSRKVCSTSLTAGPAIDALDVVPRWPLAVGLRKLHGLRVAEMGVVVVAAEAEVDASDEGDVLVRAARMADDHELLVVRAAPAGPGVEQHLAALVRDGPGQLGVLSLALVEPTGLGPPDQPERPHLAGGQLGQHVADLGALPVEPLLGVAPEVGEVHLIPGLGGAQLPVQRGEVLGAMHQGGDPVAGCPRPDLGGPVAPLGAGQEPPLDRLIRCCHGGSMHEWNLLVLRSRIPRDLSPLAPCPGRHPRTKVERSRGHSVTFTRPSFCGLPVQGGGRQWLRSRWQCRRRPSGTR